MRKAQRKDRKNRSYDKIEKFKMEIVIVIVNVNTRDVGGVARKRSEPSRMGGKLEALSESGWMGR